MAKTEPLWVVPALAFTFTTLLWGMGWSWVGLVFASVAFPLRRWRNGYFSHRTPFDPAVVLFLLASLVALCFSPDRSLSLRAFQSCVACVFLYYSLVNVLHAAFIKWAFAVGVVCILMAALLAFREGFSPPSILGGFGTWVQQQLAHLPEVPRLSRVTNPTLSAAHGLTIAAEMVLLPMGGLVLFSREGPRRIAAALVILSLLLLLLLFGSQGAWLAVSVGVALLLVWRAWWAGLPLAVAAGLGYLVYQQGWINPRSVFSRYGPSHGLKARVDLWSEAADVICRHPVTGCGLGCLGKYSTSGLLSPHSAYLQFYADMGLIGALALLSALVAGARMAVEIARAPREGTWYGLAVGILAAAVAVAVHGVFEGSPAGIIAETADGYCYIVSPVVAILAGFLVRTKRFMDESTPWNPRPEAVRHDLIAAGS